MSKLFIVGDVHGMLEPLCALIEKLAIQPEDKLVFVGDLIDKGPDSAGVIRFVEELRQTGLHDTIVVEGNHENRMRRYLCNLQERPVVAKEQSNKAPELRELRGQLGGDGSTVLNDAVPFYRSTTYGVLIVHGGIPETMQTFPQSAEEVKALSGRAAKSFHRILRTRFIDRNTGEFLPLGKQSKTDPFWAERYDGRFGHVVFGHQPFLNGPALYPHATGIDTGAVHGGGLTALVYAPEQPRYFVTVQSDCHIRYQMPTLNVPDTVDFSKNMSSL